MTKITQTIKCPKCKSSDVECKRKVSVLFIIFIIFTAGLGLILYPFLPKNCVCEKCKWKWKIKQKKFYIVLAVFVGIIILISVSGGEPTKEKETKNNKKIESDVIYTGDEAIIDNGVELVLLGRTKEDFAELQKISLANDTFGLAQMMAVGRIFEVKSGTKVKLLDSDVSLFDYNGAKRQVRILEGLQISKSGWVNYDFVKRK